MKARLPQGMGKGPSGNMNQMLKQAQEMQDKIYKNTGFMKASDL